MKNKTLFLNAAGVVLSGVIIDVLRRVFTLVDIYASAPLPAQLLLATVGMLLVFIAAVYVNMRIQAGTAWRPLQSGKLLGIARGFFWLCDVGFNINWGWLPFLQAANYYGEGWMFSHRINHHVARVVEGGAVPGWRFHVAVFLCMSLHTIDKWHCPAMRGYKK